MNNLLVICGPTATGKTELGIYLAEKHNGELISADSRQVYTGMTIGTGKEYSDAVKIWGYDLALPTDEFSVAHFQKFAHQKIAEIQSQDKLPILVGGTGLYIKSVVENINTTVVPPNERLRNTFEHASVQELFSELIKLNPEKAHSLNDSDKKNPRRLIRALEISLAPPVKQDTLPTYNTLIVGLKSDMSYLEQRLHHSIEMRMKRGMVDEVKTLLLNGVSPTSKSMTATGYREIGEYVNGKISQTRALSMWFLAERQYVKRQLTWFDKLPTIHWFDIKDGAYKSHVEEMVKKWHNK